MTRRGATPRLMAGVAAAALVLSACSPSTSQPNPSGSEGGPYTDPDYGFQLDVAPGYVQGSGQNLVFVSTPEVPVVPPAHNAVFYDAGTVISPDSAPKDIPGAQDIAKQLTSGESIHPTTFSVSVFPIGEAVTAANLAEAKSELQQPVMTNLAKELTQAGSSLGPLQDTTVAGRPAFVTEVNPGKSPADEPSLQLKTRIYWVFAGQDQYQITEQAPESQWPQVEKVFDTMLSSVVLPGTWESATASPSSSPSASTSSGSATPSSSSSP